MQQLSEQVSIVERELKRLESSKDDDRGTEFFPDALSVPGLRFELEQLLRAQKIHETVYSMLTQRLAMTRVDEARDTPAIQILDAPTVPTTPARPRGTRVIPLGTAGGLVVGALFILAPSWWRRRVRAVLKPDRASKELGS